jgi:hypothetical protein
LNTSCPNLPALPSLLDKFFLFVSNSSLEGVVGLSCSSFSVWKVSFETAASPAAVSIAGLLPDCGGVE